MSRISYEEWQRRIWEAALPFAPEDLRGMPPAEIDLHLMLERDDVGEEWVDTLRRAGEARLIDRWGAYIKAGYAAEEVMDAEERAG